jgi:hypothetical protein
VEVLLMKKLTGIILVLTLALGFLTSFSSPVGAAGKGVTDLKPNKAVSTVLSGSKKYSVKYTQTVDDYNAKFKMTLYIDGKSKLNVGNRYGYGARVWLLNVNSTTTLIYVFFYVDNGTDTHRVYRYNGSKLVMVNDIGYIVSSSGEALSAGNNEFTIECYKQEASLGIYKINAKFKYNTSSKKISKATSAYDVTFYGGYENQPGEIGGWQDNWGTASKGFKTYTSAGGSTLSFSAKKGDRLRVQKVNIMTNAVYFQVRNQQGKTGWYKDPKKWSETSMHFMEAMFAG